MDSSTRKAPQQRGQTSHSPNGTVDNFAATGNKSPPNMVGRVRVELTTNGL